MSNPVSGTRLLSVRRLNKIYRRTDLLTIKRIQVHALKDVDLEVIAGTTLALTGASGAGKSTLARCIAGLEQPTSGDILFGGESLTKPAAVHRHVQMVFQDPGASLNPRFSVASALREPARVQSRGRADRVNIWDRLAQVGLPSTLAGQLTSRLSGGQKARLALARALVALDDSRGILILDECLESLDLSIRAQLINLLLDLQERRGLTYIVITHDLSLAEHMADEVTVMAEGKIVERRRSLSRLASPSYV